MRTLLDTGQWAPCFSPSRSWLSADKATGRDRIGAHWTMRSTGTFVRRSRTSTETRGGSAPSAAAVSSAKGKKVIEAFPCKGQPGLSAYSRTLTSTFASFGSGPKERSTSVPAKGEAKAWQLRHQQDEISAPTAGPHTHAFEPCSCAEQDPELLQNRSLHTTALARLTPLISSLRVDRHTGLVRSF